jgi:murein DD-endopeptidase MepM/ murein hydrolase activator NlpD
MNISPTRSHRPRLAAVVVLAVSVAVVPSPGPAARAVAADPPRSAADGGTISVARDWQWPLAAFRLVRPFVAPPHAYGPGHRGIDLAVRGDDLVRAPASGVVAFSGQVAGRGVLTIDHGDGLVSTLEPIDSQLASGGRVAPGEVVGRLSTGGHTSPGILHFGVRLDGEYVNPLVLLGGVPRAVLLPCC